ncbi:MAG TPA: hypothetical protein VFC26_05685, partial [Verrucomicrobiae bacterium]|nr:hypothetical protein [Verrucomicrobiae bacterium]
AVHKNQRELFRIAKPCTTWGGQLAIISTHRGYDTVFNEILRDIKERANPMGWSHHRVTLEDAVSQGLAEKINNARSCGRESAADSREQFIDRLHSECLDEEQWLQEYCCIPADDNSAFITWEMITGCESPNCLKPFSYLSNPTPPSFYAGIDVARKHHLCVIDVGEKIGDVLWDRLRIELRDKTFSEIEHELFRILELPQLKRACIDATGLGMQLAERAHERFGYKVEPIHFTPAIKEELAFGLRRAFEDRLLRIDPNPALRSDLRAIRKEVTSSGNIRFIGESSDSHCDRFWAMALRQHAANHKEPMGFAFLD